jgi:hypothetical protein
MMRQCAGCASVRTLDAIHLATCRFSHAYPLVTNDRIMRKAAERIGIPLGPLLLYPPDIAQTLNPHRNLNPRTDYD